MSVVINVILGNKSYLMSDGRARDGKTGIIKSEYQRKMILLDHNTAVGYTGTLEHAQAILENYFRIKETVVLGNSFDVAILLSKIAGAINASIPIDTTFLISGRNSDNLLRSWAFGKGTDYKLTKLENSTQIGVQTRDLEHSDAPESFTTFFNIRFPFTHGTLDRRVQQTMKDYISHVADRVDSVNKNIETLIVD